MRCDGYPDAGWEPCWAPSPLPPSYPPGYDPEGPPEPEPESRVVIIPMWTPEEAE
jgi:hypothetical protein